MLETNLGLPMSHAGSLVGRAKVRKSTYHRLRSLERDKSAISSPATLPGGWTLMPRHGLAKELNVRDLAGDEKSGQLLT